MPTVLDNYQTTLRDPVAFMLLKRLADHIDLFKKYLPSYTSDDFNFPGVKIDKIVTDKLCTYFDKYDLDITNALYLNEEEIKKEKSDYIFVNRKLRLNVEPFNVTIEVDSDKSVDAVFRVFLGPKYDCMGKILKVNDKRLDMVEIDSFLYQLKNGRNVITRDSQNMHTVVKDRTWTRKLMDNTLTQDILGDVTDITYTGYEDKDWWLKTRIGFPHHLLLPKGRKGGLEMMLYVIVTPIRSGNLLNTIDVGTMRRRGACRWSVCLDSMPLGFPFDRMIDVPYFFTKNMKFADIMIFHNDNQNINTDSLMLLAEKRTITRTDEKNFLLNDSWIKNVMI